MRSYLPILTLPLLQLPGATARVFTVVNTCSYTIWPAIYTDLTVAQNVPQFPTGWESPPSTSTQFTVPDNWKSGRIWGRRNCNFTTNNGPTSCLDGGCNGGLQCDPHSGTGTPPATLAEWTLQSNGSFDFYDVSVVDGFNIPMSIIPSATNCSTASCPNDLNAGCPSQLVGPTNSSGNTVGCKSACEANLDNNPTNSANCCTGSHNTNATCPASGVQYYSYFKTSCPNSYVYAYDESSGTALWTCNSALNSDYRLTFCPPPYGGQAPAPISAVPASLIPTSTGTSSGSRTQSASSSASSSPGFKSSALAPLRFPMAPGALSVLGVVVGWLMVMV
ncbi:thaumatin family-domain-containing protein [Russula ochroleuca]|uniref:Thaumatin family-domain-containing protein n=1 Tax=Russula ochroleuca TaxID=152965 RepID=A0A9P5MST3_9AGAM|nr:thaumatin family-domain-containing protein [Russula ochroleuca]